MRDSLAELTATPYFNKNLNDYAKGIVEVINYVLEEYETLSPQITSDICAKIWNASKYLRGSVSSEIPYEVEYCLNLALTDWINEECVISTALLNDRDYHFYPADTWKSINLLLPNFHYSGFNKLLIQIALPRIYRHKPLYYIPLYHELGHFLDSHYKITDATFLEIPPPQGKSPQETQAIKQIETMHRMEFFADLFASAYLGDEYHKFLEKIAPNHSTSNTHPATQIRVKVAKEFLSGTSNQIIDVYQKVLKKLGVKNLEIKYSSPDLNTTFGNLRPYTIESSSEVHGLFGSAWAYYDQAIQKTGEPWSEIEETDISRIINDLTEKSIRNRIILEKWEYATT